MGTGQKCSKGAPVPGGSSGSNGSSGTAKNFCLVTNVIIGRAQARVPCIEDNIMHILNKVISKDIISLNCNSCRLWSAS